MRTRSLLGQGRQRRGARLGDARIASSIVVLQRELGLQEVVLLETSNGRQSDAATSSLRMHLEGSGGLSTVIFEVYCISTLRTPSSTTEVVQAKD